MKKISISILILSFLSSGIILGSSYSSNSNSSQQLAGGNLKLEIIDMGDPNDKPTIQCIVTGETCTIVTSK